MQDVAGIDRQERRDAAQENREQVKADRAEHDLGGPHIVEPFGDQRPARGGRTRLARRRRRPTASETSEARHKRARHDESRDGRKRHQEPADGGADDGRHLIARRIEHDRARNQPPLDQGRRESRARRRIEGPGAAEQSRDPVDRPEKVKPAIGHRAEQD